MVLFGQMESASNLTSVVSMAEGLQWATLQIKAPFRIVGDQASKQELFIGNLFWLSLILCCVAIHAVVTIHYVDRLPIILCFPAIEIFMMQMGFGSITTAAAVVLNPKEPIHWGYTVAAAAVMTAAAGWTVFVVATLWLHCSDDHAQCSYTLLSDVSESNTPEKVHEAELESVKLDALDAEPEPFKLDAFPEDPVLKTSDAEIWGNRLGCWKRSGCGKRGIWGNGSLQIEAEHSFEEMTVTYLQQFSVDHSES